MCRDNELIRFDWAAKHILRDKANFGILEGLITVLLGEKITIVELLESESNQETSTDKFNRVDVKAKNSKDEIIIVEVQMTHQLHYLQRILYGVSKTIVEHIDLGERYDKVKKVYSISILYCDLGEGDDYVYHGTTEFLGLHTGTSFLVNTRERDALKRIKPSKVMPEYFIIRVNQFSKIPENFLDEWVEYLKTGRVKDDSRAPGLPQVREKLRVLNMSAEDRQAYDEHIDAMRTQQDVLESYHLEGYNEGREEGRVEERHELVKTMLINGLSPQQISTFTHLPLKEIQSIASGPSH